MPPILHRFIWLPLYSWKAGPNISLILGEKKIPHPRQDEPLGYQPSGCGGAGNKKKFADPKPN
jgi:hypothetical protein